MGEIFEIAALMNGLVLVGVAVGFVLLRIEAFVEESEWAFLFKDKKVLNGYTIVVSSMFSFCRTELFEMKALLLP